MAILTTVLTAVEVLMKVMPSVMKTVDDVRPFAESFFAQLKGEELSDEDLIELEAKIDDLAAQLQVPLPPAQPGDPDFEKEDET